MGPSFKQGRRVAGRGRSLRKIHDRQDAVGAGQEVEAIFRLLGVDFLGVQRAVRLANQGQEPAQRLGHVQIVVQGVLPGRAGFVQGLIEVPAPARGAHPLKRFANAFNRETLCFARFSSSTE